MPRRPRAKSRALSHWSFVSHSVQTYRKSSAIGRLCRSTMGCSTFCKCRLNEVKFFSLPDTVQEKPMPERDRVGHLCSLQDYVVI